MNTYYSINETVKLHYGKYLYKLSIPTPIAGIFRTDFQRGGKLSYAAKNLNEYVKQAENGKVIRKSRWHSQTIDMEQLEDGFHIYKTLRYAKDYLIRCEMNTLMVYSNNIKLLDRLTNGLSNTFVEIWKPSKTSQNFLLENKHVLIVDKPSEYKYKISFGRKKAKPELGKWLEANKDKSRAGNIFIKNCKEENYINGQYIFLRDDKVLFLVNIIAGDNITRVEQVVFKDDIAS